MHRHHLHQHRHGFRITQSALTQTMNHSASLASHQFLRQSTTTRQNKVHSTSFHHYYAIKLHRKSESRTVSPSHKPLRIIYSFTPKITQQISVYKSLFSIFRHLLFLFIEIIPVYKEANLAQLSLCLLDNYSSHRLHSASTRRHDIAI